MQTCYCIWTVCAQLVLILGWDESRAVHCIKPEWPCSATELNCFASSSWCSGESFVMFAKYCFLSHLILLLEIMLISPLFFQTPVVHDESALNGLSITIPSSPQEHSEDEAMASCLVTHLSITYEALMHDQLRHHWTVLNRARDTGCV